MNPFALLAQSKPRGGVNYDKPIGPPAPKRESYDDQLKRLQNAGKSRTREDEQLDAILKGDFNKAKQIRDNDRAKKRASRGDTKTVAQKKTETPGTWNNSVAQARKRLGIKQGEDLDSLLKSALWVYRYADADETTSKAEIDDVVRMMQSPEGRNELKARIERFRNPQKPEQQVKAGNLSEAELEAKRREFDFQDSMDASGLGKTFRTIEDSQKKIESNPFIQMASKVAGSLAETATLPGIALNAAGVDVAGITEDVTKSAISGTLTTPARIPANLMKLVSGGVPIEQRGYALAELIVDALDVGGLTGMALKANKAGIKEVVKALAEEAVKAGNVAEDVIEQAVKAVDDIPEEQIDEITYSFRQPENVGGDVGVEFRPNNNESVISESPPGSTQSANTKPAQDEAGFFNAGQPVRVYHGTSKEAGEYIRKEGFGKPRSFIGMSTRGPEPPMVTYVTDKKAGAKWYSKNNFRIEDGGDVVEADVVGKIYSAKNATWDGQALGELSDYLGVPRISDDLSDNLLDIPAIKAAAKDRGIAGIRFKDSNSNRWAIAVVDQDALRLADDAKVTQNIADDLPPVTDTAADVPKAVPGPTQMEHAATANERALRDVSQYVRTSKPLDELITEASGVDARSVVNEVNTKARPMSDAEQAAVTQLYHQNKTQRNALVSQFEGADFDTQARLQSQIDLLDKEATEILEASDKAGSEWGRSGRARQLEIEASADPAAIKYRYYKATGEKQLPESLAKEVEELQKLRNDLDAANAKIADIEKQLAEQGIQGVKKAREGKKPINYVRKVNKTDFEKALEVWNKPSKGVGADKRRGAVIMPDPDKWRAAKTIVRYHFDNGVENVVELANKLIEATGMDEVLAYRAIREAVTDEGRIVNAGRAEGEEILIRGNNAYESKEVRQMRFQADRKKSEIDKAIREAERKANFQRKNWFMKSMSFLGDAAGTTRTILSMGDLSAPFRQGLVLSIAKPGSAKKAWKAMFKAFTEKNAEELAWEMTQHPRYNEAVSGGLAIVDDFAGPANKEEEFIANLFDRIKDSKTGKVINAVPAWSERTYTTFLNTLRMDAFAAYVDALESSGVKLQKQDLQQIADWVNMATGRGSLGKFEGAGDTLAKMFYSPRLLASRLQLMTGKPLWSKAKIDPDFVQRLRDMGFSEEQATKLARDKKAINGIIAKDYGTAMSVIAMTLGLASLAGMTEGDARSSRFGKIRVPGTDILVDVTGGMSSVATYLSRMGSFAASIDQLFPDWDTRKTWSGNYVNRNSPFSSPGGTTERFAANKAAPPARALYYGIHQKDFKGDETNLVKEAGKTVVPIGVQQVSENIKEGVAPEEVALAALLEFFGFGTSSDPGGKRVEVPDE